jgi:heme exporter protein D
MLAYDYPILGLFWTMLMFFLWFAWLMLLFRVFADIFRSKDMGGVAKAFWSIFVIFLPFLGVLIYVIVRGQSMTERDIAQAQQNEAQFRSYVQEAAGSGGGGGGTADELAKLADLKAKGVLSDEEFAQQKAKLLS